MQSFNEGYSKYMKIDNFSNLDFYVIDDKGLQ